MEKGFFTLLLIVITALPALAATTNTSGPWGVSASGFKNLSTALSAPSTAGKSVVVSTPATINAKTSNRPISVTAGGTINVAAGKTLTINGPFQAGPSQVFTGSGTVVFGSGAVSEILPQWWGNDTAAWNKAITVARASRTDIQSPIPVRVPNGTYTLTGPINPQGVELIGSGAVIIHDGTGGNPLFKVVATDTSNIPYQRTSIKGFSFKSINAAADCIQVGNSYDDEPNKSIYLGSANVEIANNSWNAYSGNAINIYKGESLSIHNNSFHSGVNGHDIRSNGALEGDGYYGYYANSVNITENRFSSHDRFTGGTYPSMLLDGDTIKISNNIIIGSTGKAIVLGTQSENYAVSITNNYMEQNGAAHIEAGLTSGTIRINNLEITGNRFFGGTTDGVMDHAIALNSVFGASIRDNFINNAPAGGSYYGYAVAPIQATPNRCHDVEIVGNALVDDDVTKFIGTTVRYIPNVLVKHFGLYGEFVLDGTFFTETVAAGTAIQSRYDIINSGTYQVDVMARGNGVSGNDNIVGSWLVFFDYKTGASIISSQLIGTTAQVGAIVSMALNPSAAGSTLSLYAYLTQTNNTTARFDWRIKMLHPYTP